MIGKKSAVASALVLAAAALASCGSGGGKARGDQQSASAEASPAEAKQAGYVSGYNALVGTMTGPVGNGLANSASAYASYKIPERTASSTIDLTFQPDYLAGTVDTLKKARAATGSPDTAALDAAADKLIAPLEEILRFERELGPYYASRAYRDDNLAKGKAADAPLKAAFSRALAAMEEMEQALSAYQRNASEARVAKLRAGGHEAEASLVDAVAKAEPLVDALGRDDDAAADRASAALAKAIDQMRADQGKLEAVRGRDVAYKSILDDLTKIQGLFSDYRHGDSSAKPRVVDYYNMTVRSSNSFALPN